MRHWRAALAALGLTACAQPKEAPVAPTEEQTADEVTTTPIVMPEVAAEDPRFYSDDWDIVDFWSGEWPNGASVVSAGVTVMGHADMDPNSPQEVSCPLPQYATYPPWNVERNEADLIEYWSANEIQEIAVIADFTVKTAFAAEDKTISAKAGDVIRYRYYLAEGYFIGEHNGVAYELNEGEIAEFISFPETSTPSHEWLNVKCADETGTRAWLRFEELLSVPGIERAPLNEYGVAKDLEPAP